jgi:hypothetical protein
MQWIALLQYEKRGPSAATDVHLLLLTGTRGPSPATDVHQFQVIPGHSRSFQVSSESFPGHFPDTELSGYTAAAQQALVSLRLEGSSRFL